MRLPRGGKELLLVKRFMVAVLLILLCGAPIQANPQAEAKEAAPAWLKLVDIGRYDQAYDGLASESPEKGMQKQAWVNGTELARDPNRKGRLSGRVLKETQDVTNVPATGILFKPAGKMFLFVFWERYTTGLYLDRVCMLQESTGKWRPCYVTVLPAPQQ